MIHKTYLRTHWPHFVYVLQQNYLFKSNNQPKCMHSYYIHASYSNTNRINIQQLMIRI